MADMTQITQMTDQSQSETHKHGSVLKLIAPILVEVQTAKNASIDSLLERVDQIYRKAGPKVFAEALIKIIIVPFTNPKNENANLVVKFFHKIITNIGRASQAADLANTENESNQSGNDLTLSTHMLKLCTKYTGDQRLAVRSRLCETISILLKSIPNVEEYLSNIGDSAQEKLAVALINRIKDKTPQVRVHSARALCYLQACDDFPDKDRITNELMHHLEWDPTPEVRTVIAKYAKFSTDQYPYLIDKVNDLSEDVRIAALQAIVDKIPIDKLTIGCRERILQTSLAAQSSAVNKMGERVLKEWTKRCDNNVITLLTKLDVSSNKKTAELVLKSLFRLPTPELLDSVNRSIFVDKLIPLQNLTPENAFYWRFVIETFSQFPSIAELLVPNISDMCAYLREFVKQFNTEEKQTAAYKILPQLLKIIMKTPMEEGGRVVFMDTLLGLFTFINLNSLSIKLMLKLFYQYHQGDVEHNLMEALEEMIKAEEFTKETVQTVAKPLSMLLLPLVPAVENVTALELEIADLIRMRQKKETEKSRAAKSKDFLRVNELKCEIDTILEDIGVFRTRVARAQEGAAIPTINEEHTENDGEEEECSPIALNLAFSALTAHLRKVEHVSSHVRAFYDSYVVVELANDSAEIRRLVLTLMTLVGLISPEDAGDACLVCVQALIADHEQSVKIRALQCLVDLIQHYGFDEFSDDERVEEKIRRFLRSNDYRDEVVDSPLRNLLMYFLGYQEGVAVVRCVVTGMLKLLLGNRLGAPRFVSTLLCMWANPVNESSSMFHEISTWLPMYCKMGLEQAVCVADALIPCIRKIKATSKKAQFSHALVDRLISFVISNSDQKQLNGYVKNPETIHEKIAMNLLNEMRDVEPGPVYTSYAKALKTLNLASCQEEPIQLMKKKLLRLIKKANTKTMPSLKAFYKYLSCVCTTEIEAGNLSDASERMLSGSENEYQDVEGFSSSEGELLEAEASSSFDDESQEIPPELEYLYAV